MISNQNILSISSDTTNSKTKLIKSIIPINHTNLINKTSNSGNSSSHSESISDSEKLSVSMKSALMNTKHVEINGKLQPIRTSFKPNHTVPLYNRIDDRTNNFRKNQISDNEISSSEERSFSVLEQNYGRNSLDGNDDQGDFQLPSSTTSGRTSSSISSVKNENPPITSGSTNDLQRSRSSPTSKAAAKSYLINSSDDSTKNSIRTQSQSGFFSKIFSKKVSKTTNKNSRTCSIM